MLRTATQNALAAIAYTVVLLSAIPASTEDNLESRIQTLEQELKLMKEQLQSQIKPAQNLSTPSKKSGFSTLPGWSAGYRYNLNADDKSATRIRLFLKKKSLTGNVVKMAWERQTGHVPNFFETGTIDGVSLNKWGTIYIEQEIKF
tara:strand:+ start:99 stop:536 length:438 start_codon:yes stop_codon:yes gene_type:complete